MTVACKRNCLRAPDWAVRPVAALGLALALGACAGAGLAGRPSRTPEEGYVIQTVAAMVDALNTGDVDKFMNKISTGYYRGYAQLENRLRAALAERSSFTVEASVEGVAIDDPKVNAAVSWKAAWTPKSGGPPMTAQGRVDLVFMKGMGIKLIDQNQDSLFGF